MIARRGLSLLEVMLALSILGVATAILAQVMRQASDSGLRARRLTQAQLLCESKMSEAVLGAVSLQSGGQWTPIATLTGTWYYSVATVGTEQTSMIGILVQVTDAEGMQSQPNRPLARLVQWIIDPSLQLDTKSTDEEEEASSASSSGGTPS